MRETFGAASTVGQYVLTALTQLKQSAAQAHH